MHLRHKSAPAHAPGWSSCPGSIACSQGAQAGRPRCTSEDRVPHAGPATAAPADAPAAEAPKVEEKTEFDVKLAGFEAAAKIKVIKEVRAITSLGLKEAKELVSPISAFENCLYDPEGC